MLTFTSPTAQQCHNTIQNKSQNTPNIKNSQYKMQKKITD